MSFIVWLNMFWKLAIYHSRLVKIFIKKCYSIIFLIDCIMYIFLWKVNKNHKLFLNHMKFFCFNRRAQVNLVSSTESEKSCSCCYATSVVFMWCQITSWPLNFKTVVAIVVNVMYWYSKLVMCFMRRLSTPLPGEKIFS